MMIADRRVRWPVALIAGLATISVLALILQWIIEGLFGIPWVIHWFETVPFLALFFAYLINRGLKGEREETG